MDLDRAVADGMGQQPLTELSEAMLAATPTGRLPHVHPDHSLALALERMGASGHRVMPVVGRAKVSRPGPAQLRRGRVVVRVA